MKKSRDDVNSTAFYPSINGNSNYIKCSAEELHINSVVKIITSSGGTLVGGIPYDYRTKRNEKLDVNYYLTEPIQRMHREKVVGNEYLKGMVFHGCYLNDGDMDYIINMPDWVDYNFKIIDFSNNSGITDLGIQYALRGNCSHEDGIKYKGFLGRDRLHVEKLNLSNCNISDEGAGLIAEALYDGKLASTKLINLGGNNITKSGFQKMKDIIGNVKQEIAIITETKYDTGKAIFKGTDSKFYEMSIKSDEKDAVFEFADGITGISGVSAGDTCPPTIREQIKACVGGFTVGVVSGLDLCKSTQGKSKIVCYAEKSFAGCVYGIVGVAGTQCVGGKEYEHYYKDNDKDWGFSVDGGTEIKGAYVDNSRGPMGSTFDLSEHDF